MADRHRKRRAPLVNPRTMSRPHGDLNPCLRPDASQVNCAVEQAVDPNTLEDPLFQHLLQPEVAIGDPGAPSGSQLDYPSTSSDPPGFSHPDPTHTTFSSLHNQPSYATAQQIEHHSLYGSHIERQVTGRVPPAVRNFNARAAPYVLPGLRFVPAYAPLRPSEEVRGGVVTAGVFRAGTETSVTRAPPPARRLPHLVEPVWSTAMAITLTQAPSAASTISSEDSRKILAHARELMRRTVLSTDGMPPRETCQIVIRTAASEVMGYLPQPFTLADEKTISSVQAVATATRKALKDSARGLIHEAYGLRPRLQEEQLDNEVVMKQSCIPWLLENDRWLHQLDESGTITAFYEHPALISVTLNTIWLGGLHKYLDNTIEAFAHLISLAATAIHSALSEHVDGTYNMFDFSPSKVGGVYERILAGLLDGSFRGHLSRLKLLITQRGNSLLRS